MIKQNVNQIKKNAKKIKYKFCNIEYFYNLKHCFYKNIICDNCQRKNYKKNLLMFDKQSCKHLTKTILIQFKKLLNENTKIIVKRISII